MNRPVLLYGYAIDYLGVSTELMLMELEVESFPYLVMFGYFICLGQAPRVNLDKRPVVYLGPLVSCGQDSVLTTSGVNISQLNAFFEKLFKNFLFSFKEFIRSVQSLN